MERIKLLKQIWIDGENSPALRRTAIISISILITCLLLFSQFVQYVERRPGTIIYDPVLALFSPVDLSAETFILIYVSVLYALYSFAYTPGNFIRLFQAYSLFLIFRAAAMYVTVLEPPVTIIPLADPLVEIFGGGTTLTRDLFFSGHVGILSIFIFCSADIRDRIYFITVTSIVALFVILQHVHYTVDVICSPFFSYTCCRIPFIWDKEGKK